MMDIPKMIKTFFKRGYIVREPTSSPIILALRDIERTDWQKKRQYNMAAIELSYRKQGITPQQLTTKIREFGSDLFSKKDNIIMGVWNFLDGDLKAEEEYHEAIESGATEIIIPLRMGEHGRFTLCCCGNDNSSFQFHDEIELTIYEHNIWKCPRCDKVWALRNMACVDTMEDQNESK